MLDRDMRYVVADSGAAHVATATGEAMTDGDT
jgi:hypothetical protein